MSTTNLEKALTVFAGVANRDPNLTTKYVHSQNYIEHHPRIASDVAGLRQHVARLPRGSHLEVVRAFEDGDYVFTQSDGEIFGQNTFFDVFRFEDGLIAEHWSFSASAGPPNQSGHTQIDGPTKAKDLGSTEKNKAFVRRYYETFHLAGDHSQPERYFKGDLCIRHEPSVRDGVAEFLRDVEVLMQHRTIDEIKLLLGQGDFVFIAAKAPTKVHRASTSTCTGWKTRSSSSTGAFPKRCRSRKNAKTTSTCSRLIQPPTAYLQ